MAQNQAQDYEYSGLMAQSWDLFRGDTSNWEDTLFYNELIPKTGQPVLDVGCGTGRLLLPYLQQGIDIDGVDNSPEMLNLLREKAQKMGLHPNVYLQTMESLALPRKYMTILVPSSSFQLVLDPANAHEAMIRFYGHLLPGGTLAMPFMILWTQPSDSDTIEEEWGPPKERVRPEDGLTVRRTSRSTYDLRNKLEHTEDRYELLSDAEVIHTEHHKRSPATRWYSQEETLALFRDAGFSDITMLKGFTFEPATPDDDLFTILARR